MEGLEDAGMLLEQVEAFVTIYPLDIKLNDSVLRLYVALLTAIMAAIEWFDKGFFGKETLKASAWMQMLRHFQRIASRPLYSKTHMARM